MRQLVTTMYDRIESDQSDPVGFEVASPEKSFLSPRSHRACGVADVDLLAQLSTQKWVRQLQGQLKHTRVNERKMGQELSRLGKLVEERDFQIEKLTQTN